MDITKGLAGDKATLLEYFRHRAEESLAEITTEYGESQYKKRATQINRAIVSTREALLQNFKQVAERDKWSSNDELQAVLMVTHCCNVTMIESRNSVWPYEYMAFARRNGELWEPFCKLCFEYAVKKGVRLFVPPLFADVKKSLHKEIEDYIDTLGITAEQKKELLAYYAKTWTLVTSGEIKLELDLHFESSGKRYVVDFKSGFGSNEKGNTNRLLLVGTIYKNVTSHNYNCLLLVRSDEDHNNNYFQTLKKSAIWEAYCGAATYEQIKIHSGVDLRDWIDRNIDWEGDLSDETVQHLKQNDLLKYLSW